MNFNLLIQCFKIIVMNNNTTFCHEWRLHKFEQLKKIKMIDTIYLHILTIHNDIYNT